MALPNNTSRFDSVTNSQVPAPNTTWSNLSGLTWSTWNRWPLISANSMTVLSAVTDRQTTGWFNLQLTADVSGNIAYGVFVSNSGAFAGEETRTEISPNTSNISAFYGRYFAIAANVSGDTELQLRRLDIVSSNARFDIQFNDLDTATLTSTDNINKILPLPRTIGAVTNMQVTSHNPDVQSATYVQQSNVGYVLDWRASTITTLANTLGTSATYTGYVAVGNSDAQKLQVYKTQDGVVFDLVANVANVVSGIGESVAWNHDGTKLIIGGQNASAPNNFRRYDRSGDTLTKGADPGTWPAGSVNDVCWTNTDDDYYVVAHDSSPYISIYAGNNNNKQSDPATLPPGQALTVAFSPADDFLAVGSSASPYLRIYSRSGGTFTSVTPDANPPDIVYDVSWSPDGTKLFVAYGYGTIGNPTGIKIYHRSGSTFTTISNPATVPGIDTGIFVTAWNSSGNALAIGWSGNLSNGITNKHFDVYRVSGNAFTYANATISSNLTDSVYDLVWGSGDNALFVAHNGEDTVTQGISVYDFNYSSNVFTQLGNVSTTAGNAYAVDFTLTQYNNFIEVADATAFVGSGNIRIRNETMSYTSANTTVTPNRLNGVVRGATTTEFGNSTANIHPAGSEIALISSIDFGARYFATEVLGIATAYVGSKDRTSPSVVIRDDNGNYTDGIVDAVIYALPEQYMETTDLKVR